MRGTLRLMADKDPKAGKKRNKEGQHPLVEQAEALSRELALTRKRLDGWIVDLDLWIRRGDDPSQFLTALFGELAHAFDQQLAGFRSLVDRRQGFATLEDVEEHVWQQHTASRAGRTPTSNLLDIDIYLDTYDKEPVVVAADALRELLGSIGGTTLAEVELWGSWRKRVVARVREAEALEKAAEALKAAMVNLPQAQANSENADAVSKLISSIEATPNAVLRFGTVLIVKVTVDDEPAIVTTDLNADQIRLLNRHPDWLLQPQQLLGRLSQAGDTSVAQLSQPQGG